MYLAEEDVAPGQMVVFALGVCNLMRSYVIACMVGDDIVAKLPETGELTAANASALNPTDTLECADSWVIEPP